MVTRSCSQLLETGRDKKRNNDTYIVGVFRLVLCRWSEDIHYVSSLAALLRGITGIPQRIIKTEIEKKGQKARSN